jgi:hypothetical protein
MANLPAAAANPLGFGHRLIGRGLHERRFASGAGHPAAAHLRGRRRDHRQKRYWSQTFRATKREAQKALNALVAEVDRGALAPAAKLVGALLDAWLEHIEHLGQSPTTLYGTAGWSPSYRPASRTSRSARSRRSSSTTSIATSAPSAAVSRRRCSASMPCCAAFGQAERWGWVERSPIDRATSPRVHRDEARRRSRRSWR